MNIRQNEDAFVHIFRNFLFKFLSILLKYVKIVNDSVSAFIFNDKGGLMNYSIPFFLSKIAAKFFKIETFLVKIGTKYAF